MHLAQCEDRRERASQRVRSEALDRLLLALGEQSVRLSPDGHNDPVQDVVRGVARPVACRENRLVNSTRTCGAVLEEQDS
jgi:hypothetical protein